MPRRRSEPRWRGPDYPGEFPSLGYQVADWVQAYCVIPDGPAAGDPYMLTDEMVHHLVHLYRLAPDGRSFHHLRGSQLVRPQKWGKGPFAAALTCAECGDDAPVRPDGFDADGEPVGRPWDTPQAQITAASEGQTDNVWLALLPMIRLGPLADVWPDTGETRINLPQGGKVEPVTSSALSRLGARITWAVLDETHSWTKRNGGRKLADTLRRNLAGMNGRSIETTNAPDPAEAGGPSVAQQTIANPTGVFVDYPPPPPGRFTNKRERRKAMRRLYGQCWWVDIDRIDVEVEALVGDGEIAQAERFFGNRMNSADSTAFDPSRFAKLALPRYTTPDGELIVVGVDGARFHDAVAVIATEVQTGHQWAPIILEQPPLPPDDYEHDLDAVDAIIRDLEDRYDVWRFYVDPQYIEDLFARWRERYGPRRVHDWLTWRRRQMVTAIRSYSQAQRSGELTHDGDATYSAHVANCRRVMTQIKDDHGRPLWTVEKPGDTAYIDAAVAGVISWEARNDAIAAGAVEEHLEKRRPRKSFGF